MGRSKAAEARALLRQMPQEEKYGEDARKGEKSSDIEGSGSDLPDKPKRHHKGKCDFCQKRERGATEHVDDHQSKHMRKRKSAQQVRADRMAKRVALSSI